MPADIDVAEALSRLRRSPGRVLDYVYLVDREGVLVGVLNMRELMNAPGAQPLIAGRPPPRVALLGAGHARDHHLAPALARRARSSRDRRRWTPARRDPLRHVPAAGRGRRDRAPPSTIRLRS
jgi:hypothetical protein